MSRYESLREKYQLQTKRAIQNYNETQDYKESDILVAQSPDHVLVTLLTESNTFSESFALSDNQYKIKYTTKDTNGDVICFSASIGQDVNS